MAKKSAKSCASGNMKPKGKMPMPNMPMKQMPKMPMKKGK